MGNVTKNINLAELKCNCGNCDVAIQPHEEVIEVVQDACNYFANLHGVSKVLLKITSAARCYAYNRKSEEDGGPGSNDESQHPRCSAMDIKIYINRMQIPANKVYGYFCEKYPHKFGIGSYKSFTHIDTRRVLARW